MQYVQDLRALAEIMSKQEPIEQTFALVSGQVIINRDTAAAEYKQKYINDLKQKDLELKQKQRKTKDS